ncbi:hypothetical protein C8J56DRAFT_896446 [Mycena floridula]|nr:hypothetical protein C8J56DRAFT_896446 [Mycena floridula]
MSSRSSYSLTLSSPGDTDSRRAHQGGMTTECHVQQILTFAISFGMAILQLWLLNRRRWAPPGSAMVGLQQSPQNAPMLLRSLPNRECSAEALSPSTVQGQPSTVPHSKSSHPDLSLFTAWDQPIQRHGTRATIRAETVFQQPCLSNCFMLFKDLHRYIGIFTAHLDKNATWAFQDANHATKVFPQLCLSDRLMLLKDLFKDLGAPAIIRDKMRDRHFDTHPDDNGIFTPTARSLLDVAERPSQRHGHLETPTRQQSEIGILTPHLDSNGIPTTFTLSPVYVAQRPSQRDSFQHTLMQMALQYGSGKNKKRQEKNQKSNLFDVLARQRNTFAASAGIKSSQIVQMPTKMIFFDANRIRYSLAGVLERQEDEVLPMLKRPSEQSRAWVETIHQLLSPDFPFDDPAHLPTVQIQFELGTKDYIGYAMKIDFVSCSYCGYSNILTIKPTVVSLYERLVPSWESYGQRLRSDLERERLCTVSECDSFGSKTFANAVRPHSQNDYEEKVEMVVDTLKKHLDVAQTLGNQRDQFDKAMKDIQASLKAHLDSCKNNNGHTWTDIREFTVNKFKELRKAHRAGGTDGSISLKRKSQAQPIAQQRTKTSSASTSSRAGPAAPHRSQAAPRIQFVCRLPKTLTELLNEASGPGTSLWQFEEELEDKYSFDSEATLARMQKKSRSDLIDTFTHFQLISDEYKLANASQLTFLVDAMLTPNIFPID